LSARICGVERSGSTCSVVVDRERTASVLFWRCRVETVAMAGGWAGNLLNVFVLPCGQAGEMVWRSKVTKLNG